MRVYFTETPYISDTLRTIYNKQLEVFSGELINGSVISDTVFKYSAAKKKWVEKPCTKNNKKVLNWVREDTHVFNEIPETVYLNTLFSSAELAQAAKIMMLNKLAIKVKKDVEDIMADFERKMPPYKALLEDLQENNPELFI